MAKEKNNIKKIFMHDLDIGKVSEKKAGIWRRNEVNMIKISAFSKHAFNETNSVKTLKFN